MNLYGSKLNFWTQLGPKHNFPKKREKKWRRKSFRLLGWVDNKKLKKRVFCHLMSKLCLKNGGKKKGRYAVKFDGCI